MNYQFRQITLTIHLAIITAFLNISGCTHQVTHKELHGQQLSLDSPGYYSQASLQKSFKKNGWIITRLHLAFHWSEGERKRLISRSA